MDVSRRGIFSGALFSAFAPVARKLGMLAPVAAAPVAVEVAAFVPVSDECLADVIYDIAPTKTPFLSAATLRGRRRRHDWQLDIMED